MEPLPEILVWEEIVLPQPPADENLVHWLWWLGIVLLLVTAAVWMIYRRRPRQRAKRAVKQLRRRIRKDPGNTRQHLFELRDCLRRAFGNPRLTQCTQEAIRQSAWCEYLQQLTTHCFALEAPTEEAATMLVERAHQWLKEGQM